MRPDAIMEKHCKPKREATPTALSTESNNLPTRGANKEHARGDTKHKMATALYPPACQYQSAWSLPIHMYRDINIPSRLARMRGKANLQVLSIKQAQKYS